MNCSACGAAVDEGLEGCPACFAPLERPGLLRQWWTRLRKRWTPRPVITVKAMEAFTTLDRATGKRKVYHSLEELPAEIRAQLEALPANSEVKKLLDLAAASRRVNDCLHDGGAGIDLSRPVEPFSFVCRDLAGQERTYHSLQEMPPSVRAMYRCVIQPEVRAQMEALGLSETPCNPEFTDHQDTPQGKA